jgi:hypothetical protein
MGGGTREAQYKSRFGLGTPSDTYGMQCSKSEPLERLQIGDYLVERDGSGYTLKKGGLTLGTYKEATLLLPDKALFKLDKGMLLEVSPKVIRNILSPAKAGIIGFINSDGSLQYSTIKRRYRVGFGSTSDELLEKFNEFMKEVYGIPLRIYQRKDRRHFFELVKGSKEMAQDLDNYTTKAKGEWNVPFEYLDKESARMFLKCFMSGDGSIGLYKSRGKKNPVLRVKFISINRKGLEEIAMLLRDYFSINSTIHVMDGWRGFELYVIGQDGKIKFIKEIGSFKKEHMQTIDKVLKGGDKDQKS